MVIDETTRLQTTDLLALGQHDLVIGDFIGAPEYLVITRSPASTSEQQVLLGATDHSRRDWQVIALGFTQFLERYVDAQGYEFWLR